MDLTPKEINQFRRHVYQPARKLGRSLPWRQTTNPYRILVSEIMLQQTQVDRVIPKYREFLRRFPKIHLLAQSSLANVLKVWSGLGYNREHRRLRL